MVLTFFFSDSVNFCYFNESSGFQELRSFWVINVLISLALAALTLDQPSKGTTKLVNMKRSWKSYSLPVS